jgi:hypothetical protein
MRGGGLVNQVCLLLCSADACGGIIMCTVRSRPRVTQDFPTTRNDTKLPPQCTERMGTEDGFSKLVLA